MKEELLNAIEEMLSFENVVPDEIETNCGSVWFTDNSTGKRYYVLIGECEGEN